MLTMSSLRRFFFFSSRRRHTRLQGDWSSDVCSSDLFLIIESLQKFYHYYGDDFKIAFPTGSKNLLTLWEVAGEITKRLVHIFQRDAKGKRAVFNQYEKMQEDPHFKDHLLFYEYFHPEKGYGLGASHQTGWTSIVGKLIVQYGQYIGDIDG